MRGRVRWNGMDGVLVIGRFTSYIEVKGLFVSERWGCALKEVLLEGRKYDPYIYASGCTTPRATDDAFEL